MDMVLPVLCSTKPLKPGSEKFQRIPITTNIFKLGRGLQNTVVIPYKCLSKDHCIFKKVEEEWMLENCSYSNIKINGEKLRKGETRKISDQDIIKLESSNELVYTFVSNKNSKRKRRKIENEELHNNTVVNNSESPKNCPKNDKIEVINTETVKLKEQIISEQSKKEKEIYDDYAVRIEKLEGSRKIVKRQKALLRMRRNAQLELVRVKTEERMALLQEHKTESNHNHQTRQSKDLSKQSGCGDRNTSNTDQLEAKREKDRARVKEKRELKKLRRETRRLKLEKEKKLKELETQKLRREKELQQELKEVNKKLAKQIELHEKEKRRVEQLLNQKKEEIQKVVPSTSSHSKSDMESELQCSICSELFVRATTLGCSHSFCRYCIRKWTAGRQQCPICRAQITSECRSIVLDSLVERLASTPDARSKRAELVQARDELEAKEPMTAITNRENHNNSPFDEYPNDLQSFSDENSENSSGNARESSLEPDFDMLVPMDTDSEATSGFDDNSDISSDNYESGQQSGGESAPENFENEENSPEYDYDGYTESDNQENEGENYDEAPENYAEEEEQDGDSAENYGPDDENYGPDDENYDEGENSPSDNDEQEENDAEDYNEGDESAPENYEEVENSPSENDEGENSEPENYDEGENSAPEYDGDSYPDDDGDEDYDDYNYY